MQVCVPWFIQLLPLLAASKQQWQKKRKKKKKTQREGTRPNIDGWEQGGSQFDAIGITGHLQNVLADHVDMKLKASEPRGVRLL